MGVYIMTRLMSSTDIRPRSLRRRRTALRPVVHAQARPYARPLIDMSYHPCAHSLTVSPHSVVSIPARSNLYLPIPSASTPLCHSTLSRDAAVHVRSKHGDGDIEAAPLSQSDISCTCTCVPIFSSARFHSCIYSLSTYPHDNFTCMPSHDSLHCTFRASRVYSRTRLFLDLSFSGSSMHVKPSGQTMGDIA